MSRSTIIQAKHLCKTYMTGTEQYHAIRNVDLDIYEGDFTVIMGESGSGKSTLLYLLSGLDSATTGEVIFKGRKMSEFGEKEMASFRSKHAGMIYQGIHLVPDLTLIDNVALPGYAAGADKKELKRMALELLKELSIEAQQKRLPSQVSGGQQQRAAIARALINTPDVVFADEPTGSLNYEHGIAVLDILTRLNRGGQTVVMVTHDMKAASRADRLIVIRDGRVNGILDFGKYAEQNAAERESAIFNFMTRKEQL
ncbi:ABC transporter ATP-binding protein [Paenibacillus sp. NPDC058071]|uniref:ABC transporter ATP-binding protein n=1 Tax=Paenibacillus sp. NPDC058071 TaxID=3346326 RepID=UPI0036DA1994